MTSWWLHLSLLTLLAACPSAESVPCGDDGPTCPAGWTCIEELSACINPHETLCGNGVVDTEEQCDDGNFANHDGCNWNCRLPACGDGFLDDPETCDDGNTAGTATCDSDCTLPVCGDGTLNAEAGEACDDGGTVVGDGCGPTCQREEDCNVAGDEDGDGDFDCADLDCATDPRCHPTSCSAAPVTIAMVYDSGGNGGAVYNQSFVVLKNRTGTAYDLSGHSLQTAGFFLTNWDKLDLPAESIPAHGYYLIALGTAGSEGAALPTPDAGNSAGFLSTVSLVVALMPNVTPLTACPTGAIDLFSSDVAACAEGATSTAPGTDDPTEWYARGDVGCADTDDNSIDFAVAIAGAPLNSASLTVVCDCP